MAYVDERMRNRSVTEVIKSIGTRAGGLVVLS